MAKYCVYCGNKVKENDKFCIGCGKPLLANLPKKEKEPQKASAPEKVKEKEEIEKEEESEEKEKEKQIKDKEKDREEEMEEEKTKEEEEDGVEIKPLPPDVKEQIEYHLQLNGLKQQKKTLLDKLDELEKQLKSYKFQTDFEYGEKINIQIKAVKTLMKELKEKEDIIMKNITDKFIIEKLNDDIEAKRFQLKNLVREYKLKKLKDKDVVKKLKKKYKDQLKEAENKKKELIAGIEMWIEEIFEEKTELETKKKFNKARYKSKEIPEEEYEEKDMSIKKEIEKLDNKM
ncbi:MAG: zinc-ribbon domain-containing protein [Candidatus Lokiarchaeota archaeon]|nr:zinc-ribbon domain-containing protein [Candidatus Lokiarchaeota archaeon]